MAAVEEGVATLYSSFGRRAEASESFGNTGQSWSEVCSTWQSLLEKLHRSLRQATDWEGFQYRGRVVSAIQAAEHLIGGAHPKALTSCREELERLLTDIEMSIKELDTHVRLP